MKCSVNTMTVNVLAEDNSITRPVSNWLKQWFWTSIQNPKGTYLPIIRHLLLEYTEFPKVMIQIKQYTVYFDSGNR